MRVEPRARQRELGRTSDRCALQVGHLREMLTEVVFGEADVASFLGYMLP